MTFLNESAGDRGARMIGGVVLLAAAWTLSWNAFAITLFAIGGILLATGLVGWCPAYRLFGLSTLKTPADEAALSLLSQRPSAPGSHERLFLHVLRGDDGARNATSVTTRDAICVRKRAVP